MQMNFKFHTFFVLFHIFTLVRFFFSTSYQNFIFIGLDPALPLYASGDSRTHLSAGDAKFVGMKKL
jgi:hypothetical protein